MHNININPKYKPVIQIIILIIFTVIFSLIILPSFLVSIYHSQVPNRGNSPSKAEQPLVKGSNTIKEIKVYRHATGKTDTIPFEDYVKGVVAGEMPANFEMEALKAQAVAARTYSVSKVIRSGDAGNPDHPSAPVCDDTHCQVYRDPEELKKLKSDDWMKNEWPRIEKAVDSTKGQLMYYQGKLVEQPLFFSSSGGRTENSEDVFVSALPYLRSVDSPYETEATHQNDQFTITLAQFIAKLQSAYPNKNFGTVNQNTIKIQKYSEGGRVENIQVGSQTLTGKDIRSLLGLSSTNFKLNFQGDQMVFTTNGSGHGVGMSQWGANGMAKAGYTYQQILQHYYTGVEIY